MLNGIMSQRRTIMKESHLLLIGWVIFFIFLAAPAFAELNDQCGGVIHDTAVIGDKEW